MSYLAERFVQAVRVLVGDGPIKQRLTRAFAEYLDDLPVSDFPSALRSPFGELQAVFHRFAPAGSETAVKASVQKMSAADASLHANSIVSLYIGLVGQTERAEPLKVVVPSKKAPRYLTSHP